MGLIINLVQKIVIDTNSWYLYNKKIIIKVFSNLFEILITNPKNKDVTFYSKKY